MKHGAAVREETSDLPGSAFTGSRRVWLAASVVFAVASLLIFVLPLYVPMKPAQTVSLSYLAGFNNRIAILSALGLSLFVLLLTRWSRGQITVHDRGGEKLTNTLIFGVLIASALFFAISGWLVAASHTRYLADAGYIIEQATVRRDTGRPLYSQLEFAYGPLLLLPQIWLSQLLRCSMTAAYYLCLVLESSLGLLLLSYVLNELPIRGSLRKPAFILLALGAITPHLGLNYTYLRFASVFAVLLFATRTKSLWRCTVLLSIGEVVEPLISPELGLAMAIGVIVFGLLRTWQQGWRWLVTVIVPLTCLAALLLTFGRPYLRTAAYFSRGTLNLPVGPYPHVLVFLFALVWLVPSALGRMGGSDPLSNARLFALYGSSLAFLPAALGRCDPLHVLFDGLGVLLLSFVAVTHDARWVRTAWITCIAVLVLWNHYVNDKLFDLRTAWVVRQTVLPHLPPKIKSAVVKLTVLIDPHTASVLRKRADVEFLLDTGDVEEFVGTAPVVTPLEITPTVEEELKETSYYVPEYYAFWVDMMNAGAEQRSIAEVNRYRWMLLPASVNGGFFEQAMPAESGLFQGLNLGYRQRNPVPYSPGSAFMGNLKQHWVMADHFGPYTLYQQKPVGGAQKP